MIPPVTKPKAVVSHNEAAALNQNSQTQIPIAAMIEKAAKIVPFPAPKPNTAPMLTAVSIPKYPSTIHQMSLSPGSPRQLKMNDFDQRSAIPPRIAKLMNKIGRDRGTIDLSVGFPVGAGEFGESVRSVAPAVDESLPLGLGSGVVLGPSMAC
jgi:hypothetical protein